MNGEYVFGIVHKMNVTNEQSEATSNNDDEADADDADAYDDDENYNEL